MIDRREGVSRYISMSNKKFFNSLYLIILFQLDSEIVKGIELKKAGRLLSVEAKGANSIRDPIISITKWMGVNISGLVLHSNGYDRDELLSFLW